MNFNPNSYSMPATAIGGQVQNTYPYSNGKKTRDANHAQMGTHQNPPILLRTNEVLQLRKKLSMTETALHSAYEVIFHLEARVKELEAAASTGFEDAFTADINTGHLGYSSPGHAGPTISSSQGTQRDPPFKRPTRRHKRTETPEQLFLKPFTNGVPIYTMGIEAQNIRGVLHDFFEDIRKWARFHAKKLDERTIVELSTLPELIDLFVSKSSIPHMLADKEMRQEIVAALIVRHIVTYAVGEKFMANSKHQAGEECQELLYEFGAVAEKEYALKHEICQEQHALYNRLKNQPGYRKWRTDTAEDRCQALLTKIAAFLKPGVHPERDHNLTELYVKGYRIGFRLRAEEAPAKWQIMWPVAGVEVNFQWMVNQTRKLYGDPATTYQKVTENPTKYFVRFAVTPTFTCTEFSSGVEVKTVAHSALVHVGRQGVFSHKEDSMV
ncbi:hypothetical protein P280DRAFT_468373 [Massarina eburnea CBS 473.64]|uniref:Uncharacterized protein n=1 Tax=Massarina eburnea CBS 473.64 TaxID=1395130 RepID=A0A6A6S2W6_9PLEO|nr:hypothetical protein P280DRAFT_468373 [Massarina eburnea CBS 473.64]